MLKALGIEDGALQTDGWTDLPSRKPTKQPHDANLKLQTPSASLHQQQHRRRVLISLTIPTLTLTFIRRSSSNSRQETVAVGLILLLR